MAGMISHGYGSGGEPLIDSPGGYRAHLADRWGVLSIGCEVHTLEYWIANADEIDARHRDGIAHETRALALRLKRELEEGYA